jgi:hypothetical protein
MTGYRFSGSAVRGRPEKESTMKGRHRSILLAVLLLVAVGALGGAAKGTAAEEASGIDAHADRILREMSDYLRTADEFTFRGNVTYDSVLTTGEKLQYEGTVSVAVRRPDRLNAKFTGDERQRHFFLDGGYFTLYDVAAGIYAVTEVPPEIDAAVDRIFEEYGFSVPAADLVYADPYSVLTESVEAGSLVGRHSVDGTPCHHLAFTQDAIDWQIWIEDGPRPVPRKLVITYKDRPGAPQYAERMSDWNFQPRLSDHYFQFHPPEGAHEIEFLPSEETEAEP